MEVIKNRNYYLSTINSSLVLIIAFLSVQIFGFFGFSKVIKQLSFIIILYFCLNYIRRTTFSFMAVSLARKLVKLLKDSKIRIILVFISLCIYYKVVFLLKQLLFAYMYIYIK